MTVQELLAINHLAPDSTLHVGQELQVFGTAPAPEPPLTPAASVAEPPAPAPEQAPPAPAEAPPQAPEDAPAAQTTEEAAPAPVPEASAPAVPEGPAAVLALINAHRTEAGLPPPTSSPELAPAAQAHANDCAQRNRGTHTGSDGAKLRERLARNGYVPHYASENWANAQSYEKAVERWWNEPANGPHRRNILGPTYSEAGIGVGRGSWGYYFVVDFASR
jgi:uncharacterized protein YkwD